ncbi:hypothetical protein FSC37_22945 [Piscinibacter aquaticus]|uniref:Uncharacterized protein n=1 Tax=Piscinibacter aquaticus TaxID=392597 RepID=A0A5C6TP73_9BURK|nr:hypothetical protein FSC37_22945 [Piscinibacter aquaticus]
MSRPRRPHALRMVHRPMRLPDLPEALALLLPAQVSTDAAERAAIAAQWPALLAQQPALQSGVMEDWRGPRGSASSAGACRCCSRRRRRGRCSSTASRPPSSRGASTANCVPGGCS